MAKTKSTLKIVLVQPPRDGEVRSLFTFHKNEAIGHKPPLGILILATLLRDNGFTEVHCVDAQMEGLDPEQTAARIKELAPDVVGFTVWSDWWYPVWNTMNLTRAACPDVTMLAGGPHCSVYPKDTIESSEIDYLVAGDGEEPTLEICSALVEGREIEDTPGLWRKKDGAGIAPGEKLAIVHDLTAIPAPDRTLLPYKNYNSVLNSSEFETTMITSRGCPYKCSFCKIDVQKVYARTAEQVVDEFREIARLGITDVQIYDDTFTWSRQRVIDICQGIIDSGINVRWAVRDRVNKADPELYELMHKAGCYRIHYGVESGSQRILKESGKRITLEQATETVALAKQIGFETLAFYMFGFMDETVEEARQTLNFAMKLKTDYAVFAVLIPYPGTSIYTQGLENGVLPYDFWQRFTRNPEPDYIIPHVIEHHMDIKTLLAFKNKALRRYYFRPEVVWRELRGLASLGELGRKTKMAYAILSDSLSQRIGAR